MPRKIGELFYELRTSSNALEGDINEAQRQLGKFTEWVKANPIMAVSGITAALAGVAFQAALTAAAFEKEFRQVITVLGATKEEAAALRVDLEEVSRASGKSSKELAGLFKSIAESGPNGARNVRAIAEAALALSDATGFDATAAASGLDAITDIFRIDPSQAREVAAALFEISSGRVPLADLLDTVGKIAPEASRLGLSFETASAFLVRFLDQGFTVKQTAARFKELADKGTEGRNEIIRLAGAGLEAAAAMDRLNKAQEETLRSADRQYEMLKNNLSEEWKRFGKNVLEPVADALREINNLLENSRLAREAFNRANEGKGSRPVGTGLDGADRAANSLFAMAAIQREQAAERVLQDRIAYRAAASSKETQRLADELGEKLAAIETATRKIESLSIKQIGDVQTRLRSLLNAPGVTDEQVDRVNGLLTKLGDEVATRSAKALKNSIVDLVKEAQPELRKLARENEALDRKTIEGSEKLAERLQKRLEFRVRDLTLTDKQIKQAADELRATLQGQKALDEFIDTRDRQLAVEEAIAAARAKAKEAGFTLTDQQVSEVRADALSKFDLRGTIAAAMKELDKKSPEALARALKESAEKASEVAFSIAEVAENATSIATSLGAGGTGLARIAGILGPLLRGTGNLQKAAVLSGGNFLDALRGKKGSEAQGFAIAGSLSVVTSVVQIADALDLFGNRAREQARILRENAKAFNAALIDFASTSRTELEQALRNNIAQANQVAQAGGLRGTFTSVESISEAANNLRNASGRVRETSGKAADQMLVFAAQLDALATTAADNEAKLRAANAEALSQLEQDLAVRRTALAVGATQAEQERAALEVSRNEVEIRRRFGPAADAYLAALRDVIAAEQAAAAAIAARAAVLQRLDDDNALLGGDVTARLGRSINAFGQAFGAEVAGLFEGLDISSQAGLEGAKDRIRALYERLAADGIDESERPLVEFLKRLFGEFDSAIGALPDTITTTNSKLAALDDRIRLFGTTASAQLAELRNIFVGQFGSAFDELLATVDLGSATGRAEFKNRLEQQLSGILADGVVTDEERPYYEALQRFLALVTGAISDAEAEAAAAVQAAADSRSARRVRASQTVDLFGLEGEDAFRTTLSGFGDAFANLFAQFDTATLTGITGAQAVLKGVYGALADLSDEEIFARFGLTRDEVIDAILSTNAGLRDLASGIEAVGEEATRAAAAAQSLAQQITDDYLRSSGNDRQADLNAAQRRRDEQLKAAEEAGLSESFLEQIEATYQNTVRDIEARYAAAAAKAVTDAGGSANSFAGAIGTPATSAPAAEAARRSTTRVVTDVAGIAEVTAQSLASLLRDSAAYQRVTANGITELVSLFRGGLPAPPTALLASAWRESAATRDALAGGLHIGQLTLHVHGVAGTGGSLEAQGAAVARGFLRELGSSVRGATHYLGSASRLS